MRSLPFHFSTRFFVLFVAASILFLIIQESYPGPRYMIFALDGILIAAALMDFALAPAPRNVDIQRIVLYPLAVDTPNEIRLEAVNRTGRDVSILIQDDVPDRCNADGLPIATVIRRGKPTRLSYKLSPAERGNEEFGNIHFWLAGPMGLVLKHGESEARQKVKFYPGLTLVDKGRIQPRRLSAQDMVRSIRQKGEGTEFDSLRDYVIGDDVRLMHWATTARKGKPMVRQNRIERSQTIFLVLDAGRMMTARVLGKTKFDHALNSALLLDSLGVGIGRQCRSNRHREGNPVLCGPVKRPKAFRPHPRFNVRAGTSTRRAEVLSCSVRSFRKIEDKIFGGHFHGPDR